MARRERVITFNTDGTFTDIEANGEPIYGTYTFTQYSPTVAIIQQNYTDANDAGAVSLCGGDLHLSHRRSGIS